MAGHGHSQRHFEGIPKGTVPEFEQQATVRRIAAPILASLGLVLVDIETRGRGNNSLIRFVIERLPSQGEGTENVTVEDCERAHVLIGHALDVEDPIPHTYVLEVSSPGLDRPIRAASDYERFQGRLARFKLAKPVKGQAVLIGRIQKFDGDQVWVDPAVKRQDREGRSQREAAAVALPLAEIQEARLEVEF